MHQSVFRLVLLTFFNTVLVFSLVKYNSLLWRYLFLTRKRKIFCDTCTAAMWWMLFQYDTSKAPNDSKEANKISEGGKQITI